MLFRSLFVVVSLHLWIGYAPAFAGDQAHKGIQRKTEVLIATGTARGEWEKGVFMPGRPEFRYRFEIDEGHGTAKLTELTRLKNDS